MNSVESPDASQAITDEKDLRVLSIGHYVVGGLWILAASVLILRFGSFVTHFTSPPSRGGLGPSEAAGLLGVLILLGWTIGSLTIYTGRCIKRRVKRRLGFIVAWVNLVLFPVGTVLGLASLMILSRPYAMRAYGVDRAAAGGMGVIAKAAISTFVLLVVLHLPVVSLPLVLLSTPLYLVSPALVQSGPYVEFWFAGMGLKHPFAWLVYGAYFFILSIVFHGTVAARRRLDARKADTDSRSTGAE